MTYDSSTTEFDIEPADKTPVPKNFPVFAIVAIDMLYGLNNKNEEVILAPNRAMATKAFNRRVIERIETKHFHLLEEYANVRNFNLEDTRTYEALFKSRKINDFMEWLEERSKSTDHFGIEEDYFYYGHWQIRVYCENMFNYVYRKD